MTPFLREVLAEGDALLRLVECYADRDGPALDRVRQAFRGHSRCRVVFSGMGASYCAGFSVVDELAAHGVAAFAQTTQRAGQSLSGAYTDGTLIILISRSGATKEVLQLADLAGTMVHRVGLVNDLNSPLVGRCEVVLSMHAGAETQVASKSYTGSVAALNLIAGELLGTARAQTLQEITRVAAWAHDYLISFENDVVPLRKELQHCHSVDVLGCGSSFSTAYKTGLIIRELLRLPAAPIDCADFFHGWNKLVGPGYCGIILAPEYTAQSVEARAVNTILERGGRVVLVTGATAGLPDGVSILHHPPVPASIAPLAQAVLCDAMIGAILDMKLAGAD